MTTGNETDPRDDALARAWRAQSQDLPPPALDATILAAAHRAVGSAPRDAGQQAAEATRPQRWWMPLAAAATIGVVAIGILQIAPQAPVDIVVGERAEVAGRVAPVVPAAPARDAVPGNVAGQAREAASAGSVEQAGSLTPTPATATPAPSASVPAPVTREKRSAPEVAPAPPPPSATVALADARKQVATAPATPVPEPFPADKLAGKADTQSTTRQSERKDAAEAQSAPAPAPTPAMAQTPAPPAARAPAAAMLAPAPMKKEAMARAAGSLPTADSAAKPATAARERDTSRDEGSARNAPAAASAEQARGAATTAELQARARDPDAWIASIRKLRDDGRVADAIAELRDFRRYVPDAETRMPADLRQLLPRP